MRHQRRKLWLFFVLLLLMISGYTIPAAADTAGPQFGATIPSDGRVLKAGSYLLEVPVSDQDTLDSSSAEVLINGQPVAASFDYDVASVDPIAETETYDYTRGTVSYRQQFPDNTYNVEVRIKDSLGNLSVKEWQFEVRSALAFSSLTPAPMSSLSNRTPRISAQISSPNGPINPSSVKMLLNGESVAAYFEPITGQVSYTPVAPLIPGTEVNVTVIAEDMNGLSGQSQWNFEISYSQMGDVTAKQDCLKCHTNMPQQHKMSNCSACHNVALRNIYKNSQPLPHFIADSCFRCHYTAGHDKGAIADVPAWWPIDQLYSCEQCHSHSQETITVKHQSTTSGNCQQCHVMTLSEEHARPGRLDKDGNSIDCYTCHNSTNEQVKKAIAEKNTACEACHTSASHSTVHTNTAFTTLAKDPDMNCSSCHSSTVSDEHLSGKFTSDKGYTCATCHSSSRPEVKAAIAAKNLNCEACHIDSATGQPKIHTSSGSPLHDTVFVINKDSECQECHASNLKDVHVGKPNKLDNNNPMSCATCHDSANPAVMTAIAAKNTQCDACHTSRHSSIDHSFPAGYVLSNPGNMNCADCHQGTGLTDIHVGKTNKAGVTMSCNTCHSTSSPDNVKTAVSSGQKNCDACHVIHQDTSTAHANTNFTTLAKDPDMNCSSCHSSTVSDEHLSGKFTSDKGYTCATCHSSSRPEVKAAIAAKNLNCEACHIDSATGQPKIHTSSGSPLHDTIFVINKDSECQECHASNLKDVHVGKPNKLDNNNPMSCTTCHDSANPAVITAIAAKNTQCDACHTSRHSSIDHSFPAGYVLSNPGNMNCADCHQGTGLTDIHVGKTNKAGVTMSCNTCHSTSSPDNVKTAVSSGQKNCDACHVIHQDTSTAHATTFVVNKTMACEKCHDSSIASEHTKYKTSAGQTITCGTCHSSTDTNVKNAIASGNTGCDSCHTTRHTDVQAPHKLTYIPNTSFNCSNCHQASSIGYSFTGSFHRVSGVTPDTSLLHGGTFKSPWTSASEVGCRGCHGPNPTDGKYYDKLLKGNYTTKTGTTNYTGTTELCFICHDVINSGTGFKSTTGRNLHNYSYHKVGCKYCHSGNLHSSSEPHFIATQSSTEPDSGIFGYQHETIYTYENPCGSCHG